mgnify:CR=1 FL=1
MCSRQFYCGLDNVALGSLSIVNGSQGSQALGTSSIIGWGWITCLRVHIVLLEVVNRIRQVKRLLNSSRARLVEADYHTNSNQ